MATVAAVWGRISEVYKARYALGVYVAWLNELLEELAGEGFLMPTLDRETGGVVEDYYWVKKPTGMRRINSIKHPDYDNLEYTFKEVEQKIKLLNVSVTAKESPDSAGAFQNYAVGQMDIDIDDAAEDDYRNFLLVIDKGTSKDVTIVIRNNDASAGGYCTVYFRHDLSAALSDPKITSCYLVSTNYYVLIEWSGSYTDLGSAVDEIPIDDKYEKRITDAWLNWKIRQRTSRFSKDSLEAEKRYSQVLNKIKGELRSNVGSIMPPRYLAGAAQYTGKSDRFQKEWANPRNS